MARGRVCAPLPVIAELGPRKRFDRIPPQLSTDSSRASYKRYQTCRKYAQFRKIRWRTTSASPRDRHEFSRNPPFKTKPCSVNYCTHTAGFPRQRPRPSLNPTRSATRETLSNVRTQEQPKQFPATSTLSRLYPYLPPAADNLSLLDPPLPIPPALILLLAPPVLTPDPPATTTPACGAPPIGGVRRASAAGTSPLRLLPYGGGAGGEVDVREGAFVVHVGGGESVESLAMPPAGLPLGRDEVVREARGVLGVPRRGGWE